MADVLSLADRIQKVRHSFMVDGDAPGFVDFELALEAFPDTPIADQSEGALMPYSSGTTGFPKGIKRPLPKEAYGSGDIFPVMTQLYGATDQSIYLSTAPLYHSAPLGFCLISQRAGISVVLMEEFDPQHALECIETYQVTHSQWVPTMFFKMLRLPKDVRTQYDLSSLQCAIHGAAPCAISVKEDMISWWGNVIYEYYAGSEANGLVQLNTEEWPPNAGPE